MKKRRSIIALFLAVVIAALGVGYAALTDELTVEGNVTAPTFDTKVQFAAVNQGTDLILTDKGGSPIVARISTRGEGKDAHDYFTLEIEKGFDFYGGTENSGDSITAKFKVENKNDYVVTVAETFTTGSNSLPTGKFDVTVVWDEPSNLNIAAGGYKSGTLTIKKTAYLDTDVSGATFSFTVVVTAKENTTP